VRGDWAKIYNAFIRSRGGGQLDPGGSMVPASGVI